MWSIKISGISTRIVRRGCFLFKKRGSFLWLYYGYISYWLWEWLLSVGFFSGCLKFQKVASLLYVKDSVGHNVCAGVVGQCRVVVRHPLIISIRLLACFLACHSCPPPLLSNFLELLKLFLSNYEVFPYNR